MSFWRRLQSVWAGLVYGAPSIYDVRRAHLLEATFDGTVLVYNGTVVEINAGFSRMVGAEAAVLIGEPIDSIVVEVGQMTMSATHVGLGFDRVEVIRVDGSTVQAERLVLEMDREGEELMAIRDIGQQLRLQAQVQRSQRMASVGHLASMVAHEINNPLAIMQLRVGLLRRGREGADHESDLDVLIHQIQRITHIVRNLRSFVGPTSPVRMGVSLSQIAANAHRISQESVDAYEMSFLERPYGLRVRVSEAQIQQVFVNLFLYAREVIPSEAVLEVRAYQEGERVKILVRDSLSTLNLKSVENIFEGRAFREEDLAGSALGLAISWGIVQEYGGVMFAANSPDGGGQMEFSLPADRSSISEQLRTTPLAATSARPVHVLLVEDESVLREAMTAYLRRASFEVSAASSIREALVLLEAGGVDGLVTDFSLRDATAEGLLSIVEARYPALLSQVLLISGGYADKQPKYPLMMKPFRLRELRAHLSDWRVVVG
jgi:signal transduction histidine kinase